MGHKRTLDHRYPSQRRHVAVIAVIDIAVVAVLVHIRHDAGAVEPVLAVVVDVVIMGLD